VPEALTELREGLWQLSLAGGYVNCYLVLEDDGITLVDTSRHLGAPLARVVLTHTHRDHASGLDALLRRAPAAELWLSARAAEELRGLFPRRPGDPRARVRRALFTRARARPTGTLHDGDSVGRLTVLFAPGHSPEHVAYFLAAERALIAGDAFTTKGGSVALVGQPRAAANPLAGAITNLGSRLVTWHLPTARTSAVRLRGLNPELLLVGHGPALERPLGQLDEAISAVVEGTATLGSDEEE